MNPQRNRERALKIAAVAALSIILVVLGMQIYAFMGKGNKAKQDFTDFQIKLNQAKMDRENAQKKLQYYSDPVNLGKELRARFNYKASDEKLMILVPKGATSTD
jgi:hypothetical protein